MHRFHALTHSGIAKKFIRTCNEPRDQSRFDPTMKLVRLYDAVTLEDAP
jgi:hypothetical protein